jgi:hypothetical protein
MATSAVGYQPVQGATQDPDDQEEIKRQSQLAQAMAQAQYSDPDTASMVRQATTPSTSAPPATLAAAQYGDQPSAARVASLQQQLQPHKPSTLGSLLNIGLRLAPVIGSAISGRGGTALAQGEQAANQQEMTEEQNRRESLVQQLQAATQAQEKEYESDVTNRTRSSIAAQLAAAREQVAQTGAGARIGSAQIGAGSREQVAQTGAGARVQAANIGAQARTTVGEDEIEASWNRFREGQDRQDQRQGRSIAAGYGRQANQQEFSLDRPTSSEDNRADLAQNLNENLARLEEITKRRPELFGPLSGRISQLRQNIGTDDPDLAQLKILADNIGMASQGAHQMRNGYLVEGIGQSLTNAMKNGPDAVRAAINDSRNSVATFGSINRPTLSGAVNAKTTPGIPPTRRPGTATTTRPPQGQPKQLDPQTAASILQEAGGDKNKARQLAKTRGYQF